MQKTLWLFGLALTLGLTGCGGSSGGSGPAIAALGSELIAPPLNTSLDSELIPDAAASAADSFPAELKPPVS